LNRFHIKICSAEAINADLGTAGSGFDRTVWARIRRDQSSEDASLLPDTRNMFYLLSHVHVGRNMKDRTPRLHEVFQKNPAAMI
jgi:hypothetical protein